MGVQQLTLKDVKHGTRRIDQQRRHIYLACNHSVEEDGCIYPPKHTAKRIQTNSSKDTIVTYSGECNTCEERHLIPRAIIAEVKAKAATTLKVVVGYTLSSSTSEYEARNYKCKWAKDRLILEIPCLTNDGTGHNWYPCEVGIWPVIADRSRGARQWKRCFLDFGRGHAITQNEFDIEAKVDAFEKKWNEPVVHGSSSAILPASTFHQSTFPSTMEEFEDMRDNYEWLDPDIIEIEGWGGMEDFDFDLFDD